MPLIITGLPPLTIRYPWIQTSKTLENRHIIVQSLERGLHEVKFQRSWSTMGLKEMMKCLTASRPGQRKVNIRTKLNLSRCRNLIFFLIGIYIYSFLKDHVLGDLVGKVKDGDDKKSITDHLPGTQVFQNKYSRVTLAVNPPSRDNLIQFECNSNKTILDEVPEVVKVNCLDQERCSKFTCKNFLLTGKKEIVKDALHWMSTFKKSPLDDAAFIDLTRNCERFQMLRGYHMKPVSRDDEAFPIAFTILAHTDVEQLEKLLRAIYRPQNVYCVHLDDKVSNATRHAVRSIVTCFRNVFMATKLERILYAGFSRLKADINCMQDLVQSKVSWRYLINIAAQSFPLKTNEEMVKVLQIYNGANDIEGLSGSRVIRSRFLYEFVEKNLSTQRPYMHRTGRLNPPPPFKLKIVRGSAYGIFTREFVEYVLEDEVAKGLLEWSRKTWSPDEHFWATLHHTGINQHIHPPGAYPGHPMRKPWLAVYAAWRNHDSCHGEFVHDVCVFGLEDIASLINRKEFFVNKFHLDLQPIALECMDAWIEHKVNCPPRFNDEYYRALPFVRRT